MSTASHVIFSGGGTGGHLFPGLAVAAELERQWSRSRDSLRITFAGSGAAFESRHVRAAGFEYLSLPSQPLSQRPWRFPRFVMTHLAGFRAASTFLREHDAQVVVGLGGFASVPMARAAIRTRVPLLLLEQNVLPGRANRWLAPWAHGVCAAFAESRSYFRVADIAFRVTGTPLRENFATGADQIVEITKREQRLMILGGSRGAHELNVNVPQALARLGSALSGWQIWHQTGEADVAPTQALYRDLGFVSRSGAQVNVVSFVDDMYRALARTQLVLCRAGGTTLAELAALGVPAILCPYPHAADDHQLRNAEAAAAVGGARVVDSRKTPGDLSNRLSTELKSLLTQPDLRTQMSAAMQRLARPAAGKDVATTIRHLIACAPNFTSMAA